MPKNVELLKATLKAVEEEAGKEHGHWMQDCWRTVDDRGCGTAMCFAGWAVHLSGGQFALDDRQLGKSSIRMELNEKINRAFEARNADEWYGYAFSANEAVLAEPEDDPNDVITLEDGTKLVEIRERAKRVLGIDEYEADDLFSGGNSLYGIQTYVAELLGEPVEEVVSS